MTDPISITGKTTVTGIFGHPVEHSMSPAMHNAAFQALELDYAYVPFRVAPERLQEAVKSVAALNLRGVNVTIPHKQQVMAWLDEVSEQAKLIGAVNTIVNNAGHLVGHNTDGAGFVRSLKEAKVGITGANVIIIGAGGAARAVAVALGLAGAAKVQFLVREADMASARNLCDVLVSNTRAKADVLKIGNERKVVSATEQNIIINSTPLGMYPAVAGEPPFAINLLPPSSVVCDLVYNPQQTTFLKNAANRGLQTVSGKGMLLHQGTIAFELWTGQQAPVEVMRKALDERLAVSR